MQKNKTTILKLKKYKEQKKPIVMITAYNVWQSELANAANVDIILVGDSCGMVEHGLETTLGVTTQQMVDHINAVVKGNDTSFVIGDFPFGSYQQSNELAVETAEKFMIAGCDAVKVEGMMLDRIKAIVNAGIMVMGHAGLQPQARAKIGGYRVVAKTKEGFEKLMTQCKQLQDAGCSFLLLEAVPAEVGGEIASQLTIPVYGIGAGNLVDGQLVIFHDLVGLFTKFKSKFVKRYAEVGKIIVEAMTEYADEVRTNKFPAEEHFYNIDDKELEALLGDAKWKYTNEQNSN